MGKQRLSYLGLSLATILVFTRLTIISFFTFIYILSRLVPLVSRTKLQLTIWSYTFISIGLAVIYMLALTIGLKLSATGILLILALASWLVVWRGWAFKSSEPAISSNWSSIGAAVAVAVFVCLPLLTSLSSATVLRYSAHTGDDINHLAIIEANRKVEGYLYTNNIHKYDSLVESSMTRYPQGWHINGALLESLIIKFLGIDNIAIRLSSYLIFKTVWLSICVYFVSDLIAVICSVIKLKNNYLIGFCSLSFSLILLVPLYGYGFQSFIAEIALVCASVIVAIDYIKSKEPLNKNLILILLGLLTIGTTYMWIISGITVVAILLFIVLKEIYIDKSYLSSWPWWLWGGLTFCGIFTILQLYIIFNFGGGASSGNILTSTGLAPPISGISVLVIVFAAIISLSSFVKNKRSWLIPLIAIVSAEFLIGGVYQQIKFGNLRYYIIKLAYLTTIIALSILIPLVYKKLVTLNYKQPAFNLLLIFGLLMIAPVLGINIKKSAYPIKNITAIKTPTAKYILSLDYAGKDNIIKTPSKEESFLATKLLSSTWVYNNTGRQKLLENMNQQIRH